MVIARQIIPNRKDWQHMYIKILVNAGRVSFLKEPNPKHFNRDSLYSFVHNVFNSKFLFAQCMTILYLRNPCKKQEITEPIFVR